MSSDIPDAFLDFTSSSLDALLIDPAVRDVLDEVSELNKKSGSGLEYADASQATSVLEDRWINELNLMHESAQLTGWVDYFKKSDDYPDGKVVHEFVEDVEVRSGGFTFVPVNEQAFYEDIDNQHDEDVLFNIRLMFTRLIRDEDNDVVEEIPVTIEPSNITVLAFELSMSFDQAQEILNYYCPEIIKQIDAILDDQDLGDEIIRSFSLGGLEWDLSPHGDNEVTICRAINTYLEHMHVYDTLPYAAFFNGNVLSIANDGSLQAVEVESNGPTLITINKLCFMRPIPSDEFLEEGDDGLDHFITAHVDCYIHDDDMSVPDLRFLIPVTALGYAVSLRAKFANMDDETDSPESAL